MKPTFMIAAGLLAVVTTATSLWALDPEARLDFTLEDQFGNTHTDEDCGSVVTILLGGDRKGSAYIEDWGPALHGALARDLDEGTVCSVGFAHLKGAPFFVKKKIISSFPKDPEAWTLLDWKGVIARTWGAEKDAANLYVFDGEGGLVLQVSLREYDRTQFDKIVEAVATALIDP